jgi:hypothetical protein
MKFQYPCTVAVCFRFAALLTCCLFFASHPALAQFRADALYEIGTSKTDLGPDEGQSMFGYGLGLSGSYSFRRESKVGLIAGADMLVRGFGLHLPGRLTEEVGVFQQADLSFDEFVALGFQSFAVGLYLEQRRIDRGTQAGEIGFPTSAAGFLARIRAGEDRIEFQFSYAKALGGKLRVQGIAEEPEAETGRSIRMSVRYRFSGSFAVRGEYSDTEFTFDPETTLRSFFDHRQRAFHFGLVLTVPTRPAEKQADREG